MSILKSNNADLITVLDMIKDEYNEACRVVYLNDTTEKGLLRDANNVPIHKNDMVWLLPDFSTHEVLKLGRVISWASVYVTVRLGVWSDGTEITIRKKPNRLMVVSMDEVREVTDRAKNQL